MDLDRSTSLAQVSGRRRRVQIVSFAFVLLVAASCMDNGRGDNHDPMSSLVAASSEAKMHRIRPSDADVKSGTAQETVVLVSPTGESAGSNPEKSGDADTADSPEASVSSGKVIYLTFDDGPTVTYTKRILDLLDEYDAKATFFQVGENATAHPGLTRSVIERGHALGSHTWSHKDMRKLRPGRLNRQITRTSAALGRITSRPITCLRPPYGAVNARVKKAIRGQELAMMLWDIDPRDWKRPGVAAIARRVVSRARPGAVSLMHDGGGNRSQSVKALKRILRSLSKKGYSFETLPGC